MKLLKSGNYLINIKYIKTIHLNKIFNKNFDYFIETKGCLYNPYRFGEPEKVKKFSQVFSLDLQINYFDNTNPHTIYNFQPDEAKHLIDRLDLQFNEILKIFKDEELNQENLLAILVQETKETYQQMLIIYNEVLLKIMKISDLESEIISF